MTDRTERASVELDPDCAWAIIRMAEATGESCPSILRHAVARAWSEFVAEEQACRERGLAAGRHRDFRGLPNVIVLGRRHD